MLNYVIVIGLSVALLVDHLLPYYGTQRFLTSSYAATGLSLIATYVADILSDLYARNALAIVLRGTTHNGVVTQLSFAAVNDGVLSIAKRTAQEIRSAGLSAIERARLVLVASAVLAWLTSFIWGNLSANFVADTILPLRSTETAKVWSIDPSNPYGFDACSSALLNNTVQFSYATGPVVPLGYLLEELYASTVVDAEQAVRNATARYLDDFVHVTANGTRFAAMIPPTPTNYTVYNSTLLGVNVTCAVKMGDKNMGSFANATAASMPRANANLPAGYLSIVNQTVTLPRGFTLLKVLEPATIAKANTSTDVMALPSCSDGVCQAFTNDMLFALHCGVSAVALDATITKGIPADVLASLGAAASASDLANAQRTSVVVRRVAPAPMVPAFLHNVFTGWTSALHWSWIARGYRFVYNGDAYVLSTTETQVARDYEVVLAYAALGLAYRPHSYNLTANAVNGTAGCGTTVPAGNGSAGGKIRATTPAYVVTSDSVVLTRNLAQNTYYWPIAAFAGIAGVLYAVLFPPVAVLPCGIGTMRRGYKQVNPEANGGQGEDVPQHVVLRSAVAAGCHGFVDSLHRVLPPPEAGADAGSFVLQPLVSPAAAAKEGDKAAEAAAAPDIKFILKSSSANGSNKAAKTQASVAPASQATAPHSP
ncbi:hypothetical protein H9P43_005828 [Blastocladiella emersonii ATCC 22665]|nr:hypothetical protein H9P43_005828 [Blastocladiella emersonii ATCC 22665]